MDIMTYPNLGRLVLVVVHYCLFFSFSVGVAATWVTLLLMTWMGLAGKGCWWAGLGQVGSDRVGLGWAGLFAACKLWCFAVCWHHVALLVLRNYTNTWWVDGREWRWTVPGLGGGYSVSTALAGRSCRPGKA
ncbi:hypothetical protein B0T18DRAFT_213881 [Schizothecium vesticola]|uniref:Uncharacterized protein n=1 Tax=Schizothecium vesticola TaxID=314040 RepID=A0AA40EJT5_9PEZI|nr:hypothetical protein B0T18DRAFT_213881 [Schizothecium vesticola]